MNPEDDLTRLKCVLLGSHQELVPRKISQVATDRAGGPDLWRTYRPRQFGQGRDSALLKAGKGDTGADESVIPSLQLLDPPQRNHVVRRRDSGVNEDHGIGTSGKQQRLRVPGESIEDFCEIVGANHLHEGHASV